MAEEKWQDSLPEGLRDAPYIGKAESLEDAIGKLAHAAKVNGTSVRIPGADATEDERSEFMDKLKDIDGVARMPLSDDTEGLTALMTKLGMPADVAGYTLPELEDFTWNDAQADNLRKYALDAGMTADQFNKFAANVAKQEQETGISAAQAETDARKALRDDWGETLEDREALIRGYLTHSDAPESLMAGLTGKKLDVATMNWLHAVAKQFKGDVTPISNDGSSPSPLMTKPEALEAIPKVLNDMTGMRETDPRWPALQAKLLNLHRVAHPEQAA